MASSSQETVPKDSKDTQLFKVACQGHFEKIAKSLSEERFTKLLSEGGVSKSQCKKLYAAFTSVLVEGLNDQVNDLVADENLAEKFAKRNKLLEDQKEFEGTCAWRPTGEPVKDIRSHDMHELLKMKSALVEYIDQKKTHVDNLMEEVKLCRKTAADVLETIESVNRKCDENDAKLDETSEQYLKTQKALAASGQDKRTSKLF